MNLNPTRRKANYKLMGDDLVLDIFRIGYEDFCSGQLTSKTLLYKSIHKTYQPKGLSKMQIDQVIMVVTKSAWFQDRSDVINLTYKGVEIYLGFSQTYEGRKQSEESSLWAKRAFIVALISMVLGALAILVH